ncbi:MAG TPA: hypothetical protein VH678_08355 [Xanthobacteraceae bacterium]|jgi:acetyltransferase
MRWSTTSSRVNNKALALPPRDLNLARALIARTRVSRQLKAYRNVPAADHEHPRYSHITSLKRAVRVR